MVQNRIRLKSMTLHPETLMLGYGYDLLLSRRDPSSHRFFLTSTFVFQTAEQGRDFFDYMAGRQTAPPDGQPGLI